MSAAAQRPLVIHEEKSKEVDIQEASKKLSKFLNTEAGIQSAPSGVAQQLQQLLSGIEQTKPSEESN